MTRLVTPLAGLSLLVAGCAANPPVLPSGLAGEPGGAPLELIETPFFAQSRYQCGPAALATVLVASGAPASPEALLDEVYLPARRGSLQVEMLAASRARDRLPYVIAPELPALLAELRSGRPVLVLQNLGLKSLPSWHYAVVIGFSPQRDQLILRSGVERRRLVSAARFLATWERAGAWGVVMLRPGELPAEPSHDRYLQAAASLETAGRVEAARDSYRAALQVWPESPAAWLGLGNTLFAEDHLSAAEAAYRELLSRVGDDPIAHNNLAQVLSERGCYRAALNEVGAGIDGLDAGSVVWSVLRQTREDILTRLAEAHADAPGCIVAAGSSAK